MKIATPALLAIALAPSAGLAQSDNSATSAERGEYIVTTTGCHDCHTPFVMGSNGPEPDMSRALSGHPQDIVIEGQAALSEPWGIAGSMTNTAWSGPWGVSFTANLTPDPETGVLRDYTEAQFVEAMRTGRHKGQGRQILPPMPWPAFGEMTDDDLGAVYAYLQQIPPVRNKVPEPLPPAQ